jgi:phosphoribosylformylglycinamidine synthase subunit PurS
VTRYRFEVVVMLKPRLADPQGKAIEDALPAMGWTGVGDVRVGRHVELTVDADSEAEARSRAEEIAARLLSNPVIEEHRILAAERVS